MWEINFPTLFSLFSFILLLLYVFVLFCSLSSIAEVTFHKESIISAGGKIIILVGVSH